MTDKPLSSLGDKSFEELKQTNPHGAEYWSARDLQPLLGYSQWRRFEQGIEQALSSYMDQETTRIITLPVSAK